MSKINAKERAIKEGRDIGWDKYEILLDPDACELCRNMYAGGRVGMVKNNVRHAAESAIFNEEELKKLDGPPLHKGCRCIVVTSIDNTDINSMAEAIVLKVKGL